MRRNDEVEAQRRRWTFYETINILYEKSSEDHIPNSSYYCIGKPGALPSDLLLSKTESASPAIFSFRGLKALAYYELGYYRKASETWRVHYGLIYNMQLLEITKKSLYDQIEENPANLENDLWLADLYFFVGDHANARTTYQKALARNRNSHEAKVGLAASLLMEERYQESHDVFEDLLNHGVKEKNITPFLNFLIALDKIEKANVLDQRDSYLSLIDAYRYLATLDRRKINKVISFSDRAISKNNHLDLAFFSKGVVYAKKNNIDLALEQFSWVLKANPETPKPTKGWLMFMGKWGIWKRSFKATRKPWNYRKRTPITLSTWGRF